MYKLRARRDLYLTMNKEVNTIGKLCASQVAKTQKWTYWNKQMEADGPQFECCYTDTIIATLTELNPERYTERHMH